MNHLTRVRMRTYYKDVSKPPEMTQSDLKITETMLSGLKSPHGPDEDK